MLVLFAVRILALDLSPEMIRLARERSTQFPNIDYQLADITDYPLPPAGFDCIASIASPIRNDQSPYSYSRMTTINAPSRTIAQFTPVYDGLLEDPFQGCAWRLTQLLPQVL